MKTINKSFISPLVMAASLLFCLAANAAELVAIPSATEIAEDENLSIEFKLSVDDGNAAIGPTAYEAPDFDEVNAYARSQGFESRYVNGQFKTRKTQSMVTVLHPRKAGKLVIRNIHASINGQTVRAPDLVIDVQPAGSSTGRGAPPLYGNSRVRQLPQAGVHRPRQGSGTFFLRTEPSKLKVYKGEQVILTYAIYTRVNIVGVQVERFPTLSGFLKEDIDIPVLRQRWDFSPSVVNGQEYRRAPLAQYAIFPVKDGLLPLDVFTGKFSYQSDRGMTIDEEDPFGMLNQFFKAMQTATDTRASDRVSIEVMPLPAAEQPARFSGLVGDFDITAAVDRYTVKVGEPINVKVKVEGNGHAGNMEKLVVDWPHDFELYEDKSNTQFQRTGQSTRLFEYMVIPKAQGKFEIPAIELSMFNPQTKSYQVRSTQPMTIEVLEGTLGDVYVAQDKKEGQRAEARDIRYWIDSAATAESHTLERVSRAAAAASTLLALAALGFLAVPSTARDRKNRERAGQALLENARKLAASASSSAPAELLGEVESTLAQALELRFGIKIGSLTRSEVCSELTGRVGEATAKRVERLMEICENQRFIPGAGDLTAARSAADELVRLVELF